MDTNRTKLSIFGAAGRMGKEILARARQDPGFELVALVDRESTHQELDGLAAGLGAKVSADIEQAFEGSDCIIDFSVAKASESLLDTLLAYDPSSRIPSLVIGTTGHSADGAAMIEMLGKRTAIVKSANMSVGVNICYELARLAARLAGDDADIEICEAHHRGKVDAPSGTALALGSVVAEARGQRLDETAVFSRQGQTGERPRGSIGFSVIRGGGIPGDHRVIYAFDNEVIEVKHTALDRGNFAKGALRAAHWLSGAGQDSSKGEKSSSSARPAPGIYTMADVLKAAPPLAPAQKSG